MRLRNAPLLETVMWNQGVEPVSMVSLLSTRVTASNTIVSQPHNTTVKSAAKIWRFVD